MPENEASLTSRVATAPQPCIPCLLIFPDRRTVPTNDAESRWPWMHDTGQESMSQC